MVPGLALYCLAYIPSLAILVVLSFQTYVPGGRPMPRFTFDNYLRFLTDQYYLGLLARTVLISSIAAAIAVFIAYPLAYAIVRSPRLRRIILPIVALSFFVSSIVRLYGWLGLLGRSGVLNQSLSALGLVSSPISLLYTEMGVVIGLADFAIPYAVLILVGSINRVDISWEQASQNLGAAKWQTLSRVTIPLTLSGVLSAWVLGFALSLSAVIVPLILGGGRVPMLATQVYDSMLLAVNYPFASATVILILVAVVGLVSLIGRAFSGATMVGRT